MTNQKVEKTKTGTYSIMDKIDFNSMDKEYLYKRRLTLQTHLSNPNIGEVLNKSICEGYQRDIEKISKHFNNEEEYLKWVENYISKRRKEIKDCRLIKVHYNFAGIGDFEEVMPESGLMCFENWISSNEYATYSSKNNTKANEDDIISYICKQAIYN